MEQTVFNFPKPVATLVSLLPTFPPSFAFTGLLNLALGRIILSENLQPLHGKQIAIRVKDLGLNLNFIIVAGKFTPVRSGKVPDLVISATAQELLSAGYPQGRPGHTLLQPPPDGGGRHGIGTGGQKHAGCDRVAETGCCAVVAAQRYDPDKIAFVSELMHGLGGCFLQSHVFCWIVNTHNAA